MVPVGDTWRGVSPFGLCGTLDGAIRARLDTNHIVTGTQFHRSCPLGWISAVEIFNKSNFTGAVATDKVFITVIVPVGAHRCYERAKLHVLRLLLKISWLRKLRQAINHAATAIQASAMIAVAAVGAIPQLGFIHEDSGISFCLDIADLYRAEIVLPVAFGAVKEYQRRHGPGPELEALVRKTAGRKIKETKLIPKMIDRIKELFDADDGGGDQ